LPQGSDFTTKHIAESAFEHPKDVCGVAWARSKPQDYAAALWAVGLRLQDVTSDDLEQAFADRNDSSHACDAAPPGFLSHQLILAGCLPSRSRVNVANASRYRQLELDETIFGRSQEALAQSITGRQTADTSRTGVRVLKQAGIVTGDAQRLTHPDHCGLSWTAFSVAVADEASLHLWPSLRTGSTRQGAGSG